MLIYIANKRAISVSSSERRYCETLLAYPWTHCTSPWGWTPPSRISPIITQRRPACKCLLSLHNDRSWIRAACRSIVLPVGGLQRPCSLILGVGRLREDQLIYVEIRQNVFFIIWDLYFLFFFFVKSFWINLQAKLSDIVPNIPHTHICIHESYFYFIKTTKRRKPFSAIFWWLSFKHYKYKLNEDL